MKAINIISQKGPSIEIGEVPTPQLGPNQILIKVKAAGINRADLLQKEGKYPPPPGASELLGLEVSGVLEEVGHGVNRFKKGDRVFALLAGGGYAEYVAVHEGSVMLLPNNLSFEEGAGIAEVFLTAHQALNWLGQMKADDHVLVHAGASGVGTAAIQLASLAGANVFVTAGSQEKIEYCKSLGAVDGVNYKTTKDLAGDLKTLTGGKGFDIILDFIGAPYAEVNTKVIAVDGRWILLAFMGGINAELNLASVLMKRIQLKGSTLRARTNDYKARLVEDFSNQYLKQFTDGTLRPVIDKVFDWNDAEAAHQYMENNLNKGKIILNGM
jgi:tumor protein p53-inducible protein 3